MISQTRTVVGEQPLQKIFLPDKRTLAFATYGDPAGAPLFFFHGGNDSRLEAALLHDAARELGVWIVAPDRPGYGRSTLQRGRTFTRWPADVAHLADALEIPRFAVAGHSGGGPHAAAVAHALPERLTGVTLISSPAPPGSSNRGMHPLFRIINFLMASSPGLHRRMMGQTAGQVVQDADKFFAQWGRMSAADGRLFAGRPEVRALIAAEMVEAVHQGLDGIVQEHPLYKRPWGFDLAAIERPVHVWHGLADPQAAPAWGEFLVARLPRALPHFVPGEGHFSILVNHQIDILQLAVSGLGQR